MYQRASKPYPLFSGQYIGQPGVGNYQDKEDPIEYVDTKSNQRNYQIHDHHLNERQTFRASTYANDMMAGFKSLKDSRSLCDCILVAQNVQFHVHKESAQIYQTKICPDQTSPVRTVRYVRLWPKSKPKKVNSRFRFRLFSSHVLLWNARIHFKYYSTTGRWRYFSLGIFINILKGVSSDGLNKIVNFIYTGDVQIGMNDVEDVLDAATHLQMKHIVKDSFI